METFHMEHAIAQWRRELRKHPGLEPGYIDELESHLRDCIEDMQESGASDEDAFLSAKARTLTTVEEIADEYFKARTRRSITPPWKRKQDWLDFIPPNIMLAYLKQAFRSMKAARVYTWINLLGLTLGIAASMTLFKYVLYEWRTDTFHSKLDRIAVSTIRYENSKPRLYDAGRIVFEYDSFPFIEAAIHLQFYDEGLIHEDKRYDATVLVGDSAFFEIFDFEIKNQDTQDILENPYNILISPELAEKMFGEKDPIGKPLTLNTIPFYVIGILDLPMRNSSLKFDAIVSYQARYNWSRISIDCVLLKSPKHIDSLNLAIGDFIKSRNIKYNVKYIPFSTLYHNTEIEKKRYTNFGAKDPNYFLSGDKRFEKILLIVAGILLSLSLFNYITINSVSLLKRYKELGIKKIIGANKSQLVIGFLLENFLQILLATTSAAILLWIFSASISEFLNKQIFVDRELDLLLVGTLLVSLTVLTSLYPILRFPKLRAMEAIKNISPKQKSFSGRKISLTLQFTLSICLLIVTFLFEKQLSYMLNRSLGFNTQNIVCIYMVPNKFFLPRDGAQYLYDLGHESGTEISKEIKTGLSEFMNQSRDEFIQLQSQKKANVIRVAEAIEGDPNMLYPSYGEPPTDLSKHAWKRKSSDMHYEKLNSLRTSPNFDELFGLKIIKGRYFDEKFDKARENKVVINEAAEKYFNIQSLEDACITGTIWGRGASDYQVIGVIKDYEYEHLSSEIKPLIIEFFYNQRADNLMIKLNDTQKEESLKKLQTMYYELNPEGEFKYTFIEDEIAKLYQKDKQLTQIYSFLTYLGLFISLLGLFSVSSYETQVRIKEIGIRKINGASSFQIIQLLTKDFIRYILIAALIACPLGAIIVMKYLENFAHHTSLSIGIFLAACGITLAVALLTMLWHTWQAADRNPVESLRYE